MNSIFKLVFLCVFLAVIDGTANQENFPVATTKFNDESKFTCSGTDMGCDYYAYPIRQLDCSFMSYLEGLYLREYLPPAKKCSEEVEGVRLLYILHKPVEVLIKCNNNISLSLRIKEYRKFMQRFPLIEIQRGANKSQKHLCLDRGGHMVQPLYATNVCEFEQFVIYVEGKQRAIITDFYDQSISNIRKFYDDIESYTNLFDETIYETNIVTNIGCDSEDMRSNLCHSQFVEVPTRDYGGLLMLSRIHCCCKNSSCAKFKRSTQTTMFCKTGQSDYVVKNDNVFDWNETWNEYKYPLDQLVMDTACYTTIKVSKQLIESDFTLNMTLSHTRQVDSTMKTELSSFTKSTRTACKMVVENGINDTEHDIYMVCRENVLASVNDTVYVIYNASMHILKTNKPIFDLLFAMTEKRWTLSTDMSLFLYQCYFHYKQPTSGTQDYCYFFYDSVQRRSLNIVEGENFIFMDPDLHKLKIRALLEQNRTNICVSTGGCETKKGSARSCDNNERFVLVCFCRSEARYCDLDLMKKLEKDTNWNNLEYYVPYCDVGNYTVTNTHSNDSFNIPKPTISMNQFFCFEEVTDTEDAWKKAHEMVFPVSRVGFFNYSEHGSLVENEKMCLNLKQGLSVLISKSYTSQCGHFALDEKNIPPYMRQNYTCNTGKEVDECYTIAQLQKLTNPENISSTLKERRLCEGETSNSFRHPMSMWGLGFTLQPMCYFTIPMGQTVLWAKDIDSYYYDRYNPNGENRGLFTILCDQRKWTVNDQIRGYACRLISTPMSISIQRDASELSCCCAAHLVQTYKEVILKDREKFTQGQNSVLKINEE